MNEEITQIYDEAVVRHEVAYAGFTRIYEMKYPRPTKAMIRRDVVSLMIVIALAVVMGAAIVVSSSRTIDEFGGGGIGATAFVMIEGGIMVYALFRARRTASKERLQKTVQWATAGLILTFVIGVGANIDATLHHKGIELPKEINILINFLVAISAPTLAFISSDVLAIELMATDIKRRDAELVFDEQCKEWQTELNRQWAGQQKQWGAKIEIQKPDGRADAGNRQLSAVSAVSEADGRRTDTDGRQHGYGQGYTKRTDARTRVIEYLDANPDAITMNVRELAEAIGVGKTTVADVVKSRK